MNITDDKQKRALLLYQAGPETQEIFETLTDTGDDYKTAQEKLDAYFSPMKNADCKIFQFRQAVQQPGKTVDQFATTLRKIAINCEFHDTSKEIKAVIRTTQRCPHPKHTVWKPQGTKPQPTRSNMCRRSLWTCIAAILA